MQHQHKKWTRTIKGNQKLTTVLNPLRNYIQKEIGAIDLTQFPNRPEKKLDLSIGDPTLSPQFRTHQSNLEIICKNIGRVDGYTNFQGLEQARIAIVQKFPAQNYNIIKDHVFLENGGSLAIWKAANLLANEGDNFLFPSPGFPLLLTIAKSIGITPRLYHLQPQKDWQANLEEMKSLIDEKTKFIYVNDPSNPLGSCWSAQHKKDILQICKTYNLPLIADEIYEGVTYDEPVGTFAEVSDGEVTIFKCSGLTKRWLGPGWRLGWLIVYGKQNKIQNYLRGLRNMANIVLMPHTVMQASVKQIFENQNNQPDLKRKLELMKKNEQMISSTLKQLDYCQITKASGALYSTIMLKMEKFDKQKIPNCIEFCKKLYAEENIMVFPGEFFASNLPFLRLTICCNNQKIADFLERFKRFCSTKLA